jgi:hypothetical protein
LAHAGGKAGDLVQPKVGEPERIDDLLPVNVEDAGIALGGHRVPGHVLGQVPVHRTALPGHQVGELAQCVSELLRVTERAERAQVATPGTTRTGGGA